MTYDLGAGALPTRLRLRALRAEDVHRLLLSERGRCAIADDIAMLPDLASWNRFVLQAAVADLFASGALSEDSHGELHVQRAAEADDAEGESAGTETTARIVPLVDLRPGDETATYEVVGFPQRQPDGQIRVPVRHFADPWRPGFISGEGGDEVTLVREAGERTP